MGPQDWLALWRWGDLSPSNKPHLRYSSVWSWIRAEGVHIPIPSIADSDERERRQREYQQLWRYLFVNHLAELTEKEQEAFRHGLHPSQSHDQTESVEPISKELRSELAARGFTVDVSAAHYLDGRTVLDVPLTDWPLDGQWPDDLNFFRGYEVHIYLKSPEQESPD